MAAPASIGLTWGALILAALSGLGSVYVQYTHNDRETAQRVAKLEAHREDDSQKIDHIQTQVDKLVEAWFGKK